MDGARVVTIKPAWPPPFGGAAAGPGYPPRALPRKETLTYTKELITTLLLVLALPWLAIKLLTDPGSILAGLGRRAAGKAAAS